MDKDNRLTGRVTIPTDVDVVSDTLKLMERWGADALRDCDGTDFPEALRSTGAKVYATYYTTRKDNDWARQNPDEVQQCYLMTGFTTAEGPQLRIPLMLGVSRRVAAEFTFYLAIPVMFGASLLKLMQFGLAFTGLEVAILLVGMAVAFAVSVLVIRFLMDYIRKHDFKVFGWYRIALGAVVLAYFLIR